MWESFGDKFNPYIILLFENALGLWMLWGQQVYVFCQTEYYLSRPLRINKMMRHFMEISRNCTFRDKPLLGKNLILVLSTGII
jgi:hypothetical protein